MNNTGKLTKVLIHVFDNETYSKRSKISPNPISLPVNPESFTKNYKIEVNSDQAPGTQSNDPKFNKIPPKELKLDFVFDGTNTIQGYKYNDPSDHSVKRQLEIFLKAVYDMKGEIHKPHFLKLVWGAGFKFQGVLTNLDLNYTLFESNGDPLRVKASATFVHYVGQKEREAIVKKESPDLTQSRQIKAGDRLDNLTFDIYNNVKYITQVARANGLTSFRKVNPGVELVFPPLDKTS